MLTAARAAMHRVAALGHLRDLVYLASDRQLREDLGPAPSHVCRHAVRSGWTARTSAGVLAAVWIGGLAQGLDHDRRMRLGRTIMEQEREGPSPLGWMEDFSQGHLNVVGIDVFLLRFNVANGMLAAWAAEGRSVDPGARRLLLAMAAWGLSGLEPDSVEERFAHFIGTIGTPGSSGTLPPGAR